MTGGRKAARRPVRPPLWQLGRQRSRRRWAIAVCAAVCWLFAASTTGSVVTATVLLMVIAGLCVASVAGLRAMGITRDHPWLQRMAARPWRDGQDVLTVALRHLPDVFVLTPSGSLLAPDVVELRMNPDDLASLRERMELDVVSESATEVYEDQVSRRGARFAGSCRPEVYVVADDSVPQGRYRLRQGLPVGAGSSPAGAGSRLGTRELPEVTDLSDSQLTSVDRELAVAAPVPVGAGRAATTANGVLTAVEQTRPAVPVLRLVTGSSVAETSMSGARAGRGPVELVLPDVPTVSREHARFTFSEGCWWVTNQGMNGMSLNGVPVSGKHPLCDGDTIRWGKRPDAPQSRIEIG